MSAQAWQQPQSTQASTPVQSQMAGPQGHWGSAPVQGSGMTQQPPYPVPSTFPPSPSSIGPSFRGSSQSSSDSANPQPPQPATPPPAGALVQASSNSAPAPSAYPPPPSPYPVPRWQTPSTPGPCSIPGPGGPPGLPVPPGPPWMSVRPVLSAPPGITTLPNPPGISTSQESSGNSATPVSSGAPSSSGSASSVSAPAGGASVVSASTSAAAPVSLGPSGLSGVPGQPGPPGHSGRPGPPVLSSSGPPVPPGLVPPSISPAISTGASRSTGSGVPITSGLLVPPGISEPVSQNGSAVPPPPGVSPSGLPVSSGFPASTGLLGSSAGGSIGSSVGSVPPATSGNSMSLGPQTSADSSVSGPRPLLTSSVSSSTAASTAAAAAAGSVTPVVQQPQYGTYLSVPPVPPPQQMWPQMVQTRPFFPLPTPYTPSIRPVNPPLVGAAATTRPPTASAAALVPPGEQAPLVSKSPTKTLSGNEASISSTPSVNGLTGGGGVDKSAFEVGGKFETSPKDEVVEAWTAHRTSEGTIYYYNSITGQSTYEKPPGFIGEVDKVTAQPTPVSCTQLFQEKIQFGGTDWERCETYLSLAVGDSTAVTAELIGGTGWALVKTNDAKKYYYHTITQATSWQVPVEVAEFRKKQSEEASAKPATGLLQAAKTNSEKGPISFSLNVPGVGMLGRDAHKALVPTASSSALDLVKKKLQDSASPGSGGLASSLSVSTVVDGSSLTDNAAASKNPILEGSKEKIKESTAEKSSSDSSSDSEDEDKGPTKDERVAQFKEMLKEKGIVPFSKWEKELPKIIFDPRFKAIPNHIERRSIFDHYVRTRAEEERKEKRAAQKAAVEGFKQLLEEASKEINHKTDYEAFAKAWGDDPRFQALERKDRETLLNERVLPLRKAEEERVRAIHAAAVAGFKAMLKERGEITTSGRWSRIKDSLRNDARYRTVKREDRENLFNSYVAELRAAEQEAERAAKAKREEEEKLKEREREMRKRKEREEQEMERVRVKARRKDAVTAYQALLTEKIKDPEASWTEAKPKLEKDTLGRANNPELDSADRERLFRDHVNALYERCVREYRALLADVITLDAAAKLNEDGKSILNSWSEAKRVLKSDARYSKMPRRERESLWRRYTEDVQRRLKVGASSSAKDEKHASSEGGKSAALDSSRHSPASKRNSSRR